MSDSPKLPKKLIEVALPLDDINAAASKEKSIRFGHPSTLHLWWARRPLAAARAVLFAQLVNDPGAIDELRPKRAATKEQISKRRERLFDLIRQLVQWKNTNNQSLIELAREEIARSWRETCELNKERPGFDPEKLPAFHDPFAGGGAIPLEAQRLGLEANASDLNPVAVMINKAMIEIPPRFAGQTPVGPVSSDQTSGTQEKSNSSWRGAEGLAEDVRRYGEWMREQAFERIGHLYPEVDLPAEHGGGKATVIAWLWARTVRSPNPAFQDVHVPLAKSFVLSSKKGQQAYLRPVVDGKTYRFEVEYGPIPPEARKGTKLARGAHFRCLLSGAPIEPDYIKAEGQAGRMGQKLLAVVAHASGGRRRRVFLEATRDLEKLGVCEEPEWRPTSELPVNPRWFSPPDYGMPKYADLFTPRQLVALNTYADLVGEAKEKVVKDARAAGMEDDGKPLAEGGAGATAYGDAVATYLGMAVSRLSDICNSLCTWGASKTQARHLYTRQAIPMLWDYVETGLFCQGAGDLSTTLSSMLRFVRKIGSSAPGQALQQDACVSGISDGKVVSTDPPYYDNVGYADLSDFFYVWMRRSLREIYPQLFAGIVTPKAEELIASPYRRGGRKEAESFFLEGMTRALEKLAQSVHPGFPVTIYYAFKQSETKGAETASTGWETFLDALIKSGFVITGTWPMRTERGARSTSLGTNSLASSIVLVCRKRPEGAGEVRRRKFLRELRNTLPEALEAMTGGEGGKSLIAPVDLAQAAIGPGMAVYSQYSAVLKAGKERMAVREALVEINKTIDEFFHQAEGEMDADSRFCVDWFQQYGFRKGPFGEADVLARAKGTSVQGVVDAGVLESTRGKVRLLKAGEYPQDWDPKTDTRIPVWEATHHLIRALRSGGEQASGSLLAEMPARTHRIRQLAYRLYTLCERKGWAEEAMAYNELIASWKGTVETAQTRESRSEQMELGW
jgi:putative DNA methylase